VDLQQSAKLAVTLAAAVYNTHSSTFCCNGAMMGLVLKMFERIVKKVIDVG